MTATPVRAALVAAQSAAMERIGIAALGAQHVAALSITVARDGAIVYAKGFGVREKGGAGAVDSRTIFPIGSITKQFTAAAVETLALEGKLSIDAPLATYVPDAPHARDVTVRQLLTQTSGLANYTAQRRFSRRSRRRPPSRRASCSRRSRTNRWDSNPGRGSNTATAITWRSAP